MWAGTWNGIIPRDGENIRRVATLLRYFGRRGFLQSSEWVPHSVDVLQMGVGVFGSAFPLGEDDVVYFLVNMVNQTVRGEQLAIPGATTAAGLSWYDCWNGVAIPKGSCPTSNCKMPVEADAKLHFEIEPNGFACVVGTKNATTGLSDDASLPDEAELRSATAAPAPPSNLTALLKTMKVLTSRPISSFSAAFTYLNQTLMDSGLKTPLRPAGSAVAGRETYVPGGPFQFKAYGVELEGGPDSGVDVQWPWEDHPKRHHDKHMQVGAMIVDTYPVTNAQYAAYLRASSYSPRDRANWLKQNFEDSGGAPRPGWEDKPVTYVSLEDARAYCAFHKKRLPHAYEWQYFAQGTDGRLYPWGNHWDQSNDTTLTPALSNDWVNPGPEPVGKHPSGASPFKIQDLVRSVWQYRLRCTINYSEARVSDNKSGND